MGQQFDSCARREVFFYILFFYLLGKMVPAKDPEIKHWPPPSPRNVLWGKNIVHTFYQGKNPFQFHMQSPQKMKWLAPNKYANFCYYIIYLGFFHILALTCIIVNNF